MKFYASAILCLSLLFSPGLIQAEFAHPGLFLDSAEIASIRSRVDSGEQPWKQGYDALIKEADAALQQSDLSVTFQGSKGNDYFTEQPYCGWSTTNSPCGTSCCDGKINPQADRADYKSVSDLSRSVRTLGLAYALSGESRYADKAVTLLRAWFIAPATRMNPKITNNQSQIELYITIPGIYYGADLIWHHSGWSEKEREDFQAWTATFMQDVKARSHGTNYENWRLVLLSAGAYIGGDSALLDVAFETWKNKIRDQVNAKGELTPELDRTKSLDYSTYALNAMAQTAEIARHQGIDLYNYKLNDGRGLELVLDYHAPFIVNPGNWTHPQIDAYKGENGAIYELAYSIWQKPAYKAVIDKLGRPLNEIRTLGLTTLTHSFGIQGTTSIQVESSLPGSKFQGNKLFIGEGAALPLQDMHNPASLRDMQGRIFQPGEKPARGVFVIPEVAAPDRIAEPDTASY